MKCTIIFFGKIFTGQIVHEWFLDYLSICLWGGRQVGIGWMHAFPQNSGLLLWGKYLIQYTYAHTHSPYNFLISMSYCFCSTISTWANNCSHSQMPISLIYFLKRGVNDESETNTQRSYCMCFKKFHSGL